MSFKFLNEGQSGNIQQITPIDTFIDPVSKIRVSNPSNLIDTDFEYGLQPTKWETVELINNTPAFFSKGGDTSIPDITSMTTNTGTREITVTTAFPHNLDAGIPIRVEGTKSVTADGSYIINATPSPTTFTYLSRANQAETVSIFDLYTSVITGEFFQGSQISIDSAEGITTNGTDTGNDSFSTLTVKTENKHGFGPNTPFYFLNLNSTISQEFEASNTASVSFDPTNSAVAQTFDGSNTLLQTPVDLSNSATSSTNENIIQNTTPLDSTFTVEINQNNEDKWDNLVFGDPLYYDISAGGGYFQNNPRGVVFIKETNGIDVANNTATFEVSEIPNGTTIPVLANTQGFFQVADQARTFAGNNVNEQTQIELQVEVGQEFVFDGGNQGYDGDSESPPDNTGTVVGYTGTTINLFTAEGSLDYYVGAMLKYNSEGSDATGLESDATYFVTSFAEGQGAGLFTMSIAPLPGGNNISVSGGSGTQTFSKIGVSVDKDIIHVRNSNFEEGDMLEYTFPENGNFGADIEKSFYFVDDAFDEHNYRLSEDVGFRPIVATGGNSITEIFDEGRVWKIHAFTSVGNSNFTISDIGKENQIEYLVVGGGGGGGNSSDTGGGGGGGLRYGFYEPTSPQTFTITVGAGGGRSGNGQNSSAFGFTANGGIGAPATGAGPGGASGAPQSNSGGAGGGPGSEGGGGGGAGQAGFNAGANPSGARPGRGGDGLFYGNRFGNNFGDFRNPGWFASGGGGGGETTSPPFARGGGGIGAGSTSQTDRDGQANTGGGGGGNRDSSPFNNNSRNAGSGGSGIVLARYPITSEPSGKFILASGGELSVYNDSEFIYVIHAFKSSSSFNVSALAADSDNNEIEYLIVGGGGGGGNSSDTGGGGGGGIRYGFTTITNAQNFTITVGNGGGRGGNGQNSSAFGLTANGGIAAPPTGAGPGGASGAPQSNSGGAGGGPGSEGGGGGGAGQAGFAAGVNPSGTRPGRGGDGLFYGNRFGNNFGDFRNPGWFASGGGGGGERTAPPFARGGGGIGGSGSTQGTRNAQPNTGGGGGGNEDVSSNSNRNAGTGGSGIVLIKYKIGEAE